MHTERSKVFGVSVPNKFRDVGGHKLTRLLVVIEMVSEKLTEYSVNVMALARMEAERTGCACVDVEHILLGLVGECCGVASEVLRISGLRVESVREHISDQTREERMSQRDSFSFNIKAGKILNSALEFAVQTENEYIDTEHLLLAVLAEKNWKVQKVFDEFGIDSNKLRSDIGAAIQERAENPPPADVPENETVPRRKRAISPTAEYAWPSTTPMFSHFNDSAIQVVMRAQEESRRLGHNFVGTEQLLLGVFQDKGIAGNLLRNLGVTINAARREVEKIIGRGSGFVAVEIPFTPRAKGILTKAIDDARGRGSDMIAAEHILLSLLGEQDSVSASVLQNLDVQMENMRCNLHEALVSPAVEE